MATGDRADPVTALLAINLGLLALGFVVLHAARRWPRVVAVGLGAAVAAGLATLAYAGYGSPESAAPWFAAGLALLMLGIPASLLVAAARDPATARFSWAGVREWLRLVGQFVSDPFAERKPRAPARELARLAAVLFGYLAFCWLAAIALGVLAHLTNPAGSFR